MTRPLKTLLLGLGNDLLRDDAVGLRIADTLANGGELGSAGIVVLQTAEMGLALLDLVTGYDRLFIVDSIQTGKAEPGTLHTLHGSELRTIPGISPHFVGIGEMLSLGELLGLHVPREVTVFAIEVADPFTMGTTLTPALELRFPELTAEIKAQVLEATTFLTNAAARFNTLQP